MTGRRKLILSYDVGTTSLKTCVYSIGESFRLTASTMAEYSLNIFGSCAEQEPEAWYQAMIETTEKVLMEPGIDAGDILGISFCSQMQGLVLVDKTGKALRPAMSYMDGRASGQKNKAGGFKIEGLPVWKLLRSIQITGIAPTSAKDPLWKYHWVRDNEPEIFENVYKWLDVKEYLIMRLTGAAVMTRDSACATFMYDNRPGRGCWSTELCRLYGVNPAHLPHIIGSEQAAGALRSGEAADMGLSAGVPVFGGGGDASLIGLGSGAVNENDIHIYMGTSGWVSAVTSKRRLDLKHMIGSITCALPDRYHYFSEQETAGKCMEWVCRHLALDEIGIYLEKKEIADDPETIYANLFEYLSEVVSETEAGCGGVIFTPWLHGSRSPFEDPDARGMFFNIGLNTGKRMLIRAVVEGLCYNLRWMLESLEEGFPCNERIKFVGGGAQSAVTARILSDILGRSLEVPPDPQSSGALGAAVVAGIGLGELDSYEDVPSRIRPGFVVTPDKTHCEIYDKNYAVFKKLYKANRALFSELNHQNRGRDR